MSSMLHNLSAEQLAELKAKAKARLHQHQQQPKAPNSSFKQPQNKSKEDVLLKGAIKLNIENRVKKAKQKAKLGIYRANKEQKAIKTEIVEESREQLARKYHELKAQTEGYKEADKLKKKYAKKLLEAETEAMSYKERLETPLDEYLNILALEKLEKKERNKKIGFIVKTIFTFGYYAYREGKKEMFLRTGGLDVN